MLVPWWKIPVAGAGAQNDASVPGHDTNPGYRQIARPALHRPQAPPRRGTNCEEQLVVVAVIFRDPVSHGNRCLIPGDPDPCPRPRLPHPPRPPLTHLN